MEPKGSSPHSRQPVAYPRSTQTMPPISLPEDPSECFPPTYAWIFQVDSFPQVSPPKTLYTPLLSPIRATCPAHLILLEFVTRTILGEEYRSLSSSLCSFLHSPVSSSLSGPNIPLSTLFSNSLSLVHPSM